MTDDAERQIRTLILDLVREVQELRTQVCQMEEANAARYDMLLTLCVPEELREEIEAFDGVEFEVSAAPFDVAGPLRDWMKKTR